MIIGYKNANEEMESEDDSSFEGSDEKTLKISWW